MIAVSKVRWIALATAALAISACVSSARAEDRLFVAAGNGTDDSGPFRGAATDAGLFTLTGEIAVSPRGSFLIAVNDPGPMVLRVSSKGRIRRIAGRPDFGFSGDGGPATKARLGDVNDIALTGDGGFLVTDSENCRVRRVGRDGVIRTVAGSGPRSPGGCLPEEAAGPAPGDGGPATAARLRNPSGVAALPDGGFLVSEGNRVRRVGSDGKIRTVAGTGGALDSDTTPEFGKPATSVRLAAPRGLAPVPGGGFLVQNQYGVYRVRADGVIVPAAGPGTILSDGGALYAFVGDPWRLSGPLPGRGILIAQGRVNDYFAGFGALATKAPFGGIGDAEPTADGGLLVSTSEAFEAPHRVVFRAPPGTTRLGVALARETLPALLHRRLRFRLTRAARVRIKIFRGRRVVARRSVAARKGLNTVRLPRRVRRGLRYVKLRANSRDGAVATNGLRVLVGNWLPKGVVGDQILAIEACGDCEGDEATIESCRRFGARRVDCVAGIENVDDGPTPCTTVYSAVLRRSGYLYLRPYACHRRKRGGYFRRRPKYRAPFQLGSPL